MESERPINVSRDTVFTPSVATGHYVFIHAGAFLTDYLTRIIM
ncbi:MAG: hypothetical protein WBF08_03305 [Candidatus Bathyarchaeia archaeon]